LKAVFAAVVVAATLGVGSGRVVSAAAQAPAHSDSVEKRIWYFYTVKWGKQDRFVELFRMNHYPILRAQVGTRLKSVKTFVPTYHGDGRSDWTFVVEIVYKDEQAAITPWDGEEAFIRKTWPDQASFKQQEQERFDILTAHWDVPLNETNLDTRK
jgi:hypothetical protein